MNEAVARNIYDNVATVEEPSQVRVAGVPFQPGDLLSSPLYVARDEDAAGLKVTGYNQSLRYSLLGSEDRRGSQYSLLPDMKCAL